MHTLHSSCRGPGEGRDCKQSTTSTKVAPDHTHFKIWIGPGQVAQLSQSNKVVGSILGQGTNKNQPKNVSISGTANQCFCLSRSLSL